MGGTHAPGTPRGLAFHLVCASLGLANRVVCPRLLEPIAGVLGILLSFPQKAQDIEENEKKRRRLVAVCYLFGFGGLFIGYFQKGQADEQMRGMVRDEQNALNLITGDDSYIHFDMASFAGPSPAQAGNQRIFVPVQAIPIFEGKFPLHDVSVGAFCNVIGWLTGPYGVQSGTYYPAPPDYGRPHASIPLQFAPNYPEKDSECSLTINTSNGAYLQRIRFRYRGNKWTWASRISRFDGAKFDGSQRHDFQDPDFPKDQLAGDW